MKSVIVVFDGSNRQDDLARAILAATGQAAIFQPASETALPPKTDFVFLPGGFSYGDYLRSGAMAAKTPIMRAVKQFAGGGGRVLGICNGFQVLCESGLLPGLLRPNAHGQFICRWQKLKPESNFIKLFGASSVTLPIAHGDGNFQTTDDDVKKLQDSGQILAYYDGNPNGSAGDIAGVCNETKNVFGMMPHPENYIADFQNPNPAAPTNPNQAKDGLAFFKNFFS
ncbi:MAG: phosphoribosylformylglycinamidine synthase subunit PurQ [Hydrotalea sp.]|nr:phosphoribosylformylglycinamidine synthase subunit PurQ [Hydrotalea sp.]